MAYLIDGNNLRGHISPSDQRDPQSKYELVAKLWKFQNATKSRVILVFDGAPDPRLTHEKFQTKKFSVVYPPLGTNADSVIKETIARQTDLKKFFVVTSDRDLRAFARARGARSLSSKEFASKLKEILKEQRKISELKKKAVSLSPLEVNLWLETFGEKK